MDSYLKKRDWDLFNRTFGTNKVMFTLDPKIKYAQPDENRPEVRFPTRYREPYHIGKDRINKNGHYHVYLLDENMCYLGWVHFWDLEPINITGFHINK